MGRTNWYDSTIQKLLENEIYKGDFVHDKRTKTPTYYKDVVEPTREEKANLVMNYIDEIKLYETSNHICKVDEIFFRESIAKPCNELYDEDILDNNDIDIIQNNKNNEKSDDFEK